MMKRKILGPEKAAILLMDLGEEKAAQVLANMDEREIQILRVEQRDKFLIKTVL